MTAASVNLSHLFDINNPLTSHGKNVMRYSGNLFTVKPQVLQNKATIKHLIVLGVKNIRTILMGH